MKYLLILLFVFLGAAIYSIFRFGSRYARKAMPERTGPLREDEGAEEEGRKLPGAYVTKP